MIRLWIRILSEQRAPGATVDRPGIMRRNKMRLADFRAALPTRDFWVFGYGSLMWSPCFAYRERRLARVHGYYRALCILSTRYRGTHRKPGLVMGLCRGGSCWGMAYRISRSEVGRSLARLWNREMPRRVYEPRLVPTTLPGGRRVQALAFIADPDHPSYVRELALSLRNAAPSACAPVLSPGARAASRSSV